MDNNQQTTGAGAEQPSASTPVTNQAGPAAPISAPAVSDLNINNPTSMGVSPFVASDVSMTTPLKAGGNITTTEVGSKGNVVAGNTDAGMQ